MAPGQEANGDNLGRLLNLLYNTVRLGVLINRRDEAILMSIHNKQFHDERRTFP